MVEETVVSQLALAHWLLRIQCFLPQPRAYLDFSSALDDPPVCPGRFRAFNIGDLLDDLDEPESPGVADGSALTSHSGGLSHCMFMVSMHTKVLEYFNES